jgi:polysaccharide export outer membrane protein
MMSQIYQYVKMAFIGCVLALFVAQAFLSAQQTTKPPDVPVIKPAEKTLNDKLLELRSLSGPRPASDYVIGPEDVLEVLVFKVPELSRVLHVSAQGRITLPPLGEIPVAGLTTPEVEIKLEGLLKERVLENPHVSVQVKEYRSQSFFVLGAVYRPGTYPLTHSISLVDALSVAGGFTEKAGDKVFIHRAPAAGSNADNDATKSKLEVDLKALLLDGNINLNLPIRPGDIINVLPRPERLFYVLGEVGRPGAYEVKDKPLRLSHALALAGGTLKTAKLHEAIVVRPVAENKREQIAVNIKNVLKGKAEDIVIKQEDLIFIPGSGSKTFSDYLIQGFPGILSSMIFVAAR